MLLMVLFSFNAKGEGGYLRKNLLSLAYSLSHKPFESGVKEMQEELSLHYY